MRFDPFLCEPVRSLEFLGWSTSILAVLGATSSPLPQTIREWIRTGKIILTTAGLWYVSYRVSHVVVCGIA